MGKSSFTLLETIFSITILSFLVGMFYKLTYLNNDNNKLILLEKIENDFTKKNYQKDFLKSKKSITIFKDEKEFNIDIFTYKYNKNGIKLVSYELEK